MKRVLLRDFIFDRLYHPTEGYFCRPDFQLGEMKQPLDFKSMIGFDDYQKELQRNYPQNAWLTPSEIFKPYYGMTVANYIMNAHRRYEQKHKQKKDIRIIEAGAGLGSAAESILNYFKLYESKAYEELTYTIVEISPVLCKKLKDKLEAANPRLARSGRLRIINDDFLSYRDQSQQLSYVLLFEVLDNLPHDKVTVGDEPGKYKLETRASLQTNEQQLVPISDKLIADCLSYYLQTPKPTGSTTKKKLVDRITDFYLQRFMKKTVNTDVLFLPTYCLKMLRRLKFSIPNSHVIISDFDALPSQIAGVNAPIVSHKGKESFEKKDYSTYLVNRGSADIFFPTSFELLKVMYEGESGKKGQHLKTHQFVKQFSQQNWATTRSGYNPIQQDFLNTSFFLTTV